MDTEAPALTLAEAQERLRSIAYSALTMSDTLETKLKHNERAVMAGQALRTASMAATTVWTDSEDIVEIFTAFRTLSETVGQYLPMFLGLLESQNTEAQKKETELTDAKRLVSNATLRLIDLFGELRADGYAMNGIRDVIGAALFTLRRATDPQRFTEILTEIGAELTKNKHMLTAARRPHFSTDPEVIARFEYHDEVLAVGSVRLERLRQLGSEGWHLVDVVLTPGGALLHTFIRPAKAQASIT